MQPVLSHGYNGGNWGCYYYINVWYLYTGGSIVTAGQRVNVGDSLQGYMTYSSNHLGSCCWWEGEMIDSTNLALQTEWVQTSYFGGFSAMRWIFGGVLEAYGVASCSYYPNGSTGSTNFTSISIYDSSGSSITPSLSSFTTTQTPQCSYGVTTSSTSVNLAY